MDEKTIRNNDEMEIDLQRVFNALLKKSWLIGLVSVACAGLALLITILFVTPQYQSTAMFYVNNNSFSLGDAAASISTGDINASRGLVKSYIVILNTRETLNDVIDYAGVDYSYGQLKQMITAEAVDSTEIFKVVVTSPDPQEAELIASAVSYILPKRINSIIDGTSAKIVDSAVQPSSPSSPSYTRNAMSGFLMGLAISAFAVALQVVLDVTVRTEEDVVQNCKYPILASVPDMSNPGKGGYGYAYDRKKKTAQTPGKQPVMIGKEMSFDATESYKLLRTKLQFAFADENASHIIGITSGLSGEGKSLTAINLAHSLSQLGKRVVLIDCDMRRPTLAEKLQIQKKPGLSNFLTGQCSLDDLTQFCGIKGDENAFLVVAAGPNPPNPVELLSSGKMSKLLRGLRKVCDYVIMDLPPVEEVSDALAVANETDGILMVARESRCDRIILRDTIQQLEFVGAKILGVVYNGASVGGTKYGKKYYYKRYGRKYYTRPYAANNEAAKSAGSKGE